MQLQCSRRQSSSPLGCAGADVHMQGPRQRLLPQWMPRCGSCMRLFAAEMEPVAIPHECSCDPHQAPAHPVVTKRSLEMFVTQNSAGQAVHHLVGGIKHAGRLPSGGEGGATARAAPDQSLWARLLRFHCSPSRFGPCAEWCTQQPSSEREGINDGLDAHSRST